MVIFGLLLLIYLYFKYKFSYWKKRGFPFIQPTNIFGNFKEIILQQTAVGQHFQHMYNLGKGKPYIGFYAFGRPSLLLRDPDLIKLVLVKEFNVFYDRHVYSSKGTDPLGTSNLFMLKGPAWKYLRSKLNPAFTTFRMKQVCSLIEICSNHVTDYLEKTSHLDKPIEVRELMGKYGTDVITSCAFGIESNSLSDPNAEFRQFGRKIIETSVFRSFEFMSMFVLPEASKFMNMKFFSTETSDFLRKAFWDTVNQREEKNIQRDDFLQLLIQLKNKGRVDEEKNGLEAEKVNADNDTVDQKLFKFEGDNLVAQAAIFFTAGFEAIATNGSFILYHLAMHPEVQEKARAEIHEVLESEKGKLTYEALNKMEYLQMVISETLRLFPNLSVLDRVPKRDYVLPGTNLTLEKGTPVYIPLMGLHMDPNIYPNPEKFDPERFSPENIKKRHPFTYLPFGDGPKFCVGKRFGIMAVKTGMISILQNFEVSPCAETPVPLVLDPKAMILAPIGGIPLKFNRIKV